MSSPALHAPPGGPPRHDDPDRRAAGREGSRSADGGGLRRSRTLLQVIVLVVAAVLVAGGTAGLLLIADGAVDPFTGAVVMVVVGTAVVLLGAVGAVVALRPVFAAARSGGADAERSGAAARPPAHPGDAPSPPPSRREAATEQERNPEVFSRIANRLQAKVARAFGDLDALERRIEDPEILAIVFRLDHLVTRIRREVENLSVLGGDAPQARSSQPAEVNQVLRLAIASTEDYQRIMTSPLRGVRIHGHVVAELINLLAELLDNATTFTPPHAPKITLTASRVAAGLAIEIHDRGIGMAPQDIDRVNRLLGGEAEVDLHQLLDEGRIGFAVVNKLAPRHGIKVQLRANIFGGVDAAVVLPHELLSEPEDVHRVANAPVASAPAAEPGVVPALPRRQDPRPGEGTWPPVAAPSEPADPADTGRHRRLGAVPSVQRPSPVPRAAPWERPAAQDDPPVPRPVPAPGQEPPAADRPPLPRRGAGTYLRPELRQPPQVSAVSPGHNPDLLAEVMRGRGQAEYEDSDGGQ